MATLFDVGEPAPTCTRCGVAKPAAEFSLNRREKTGRHPWCRACHAEWKRAYRAANPEKVRERKRAYRAANAEKVRERKRARYAANAEKAREYWRAWYAANPEKARRVKKRLAELLTGARGRAKKKGLAYDLDEHQGELQARLDRGVCELSGRPFFVVIGRGRHPDAPSIDRIDPGRGYTVGNVQLVCWWVNSAKGKMTNDEFLEWYGGLQRWIRGEVCDAAA